MAIAVDDLELCPLWQPERLGRPRLDDDFL